MIFDCHTHWGDVFRQRYGSDISDWWETLQRSEITHAVVLPHAGLEDSGLIVEDNDAVADVCRDRPHLLPFCTAHPFRAKAAVAEVERCLSAGFRGVKLHPWLQGLSLSSAGVDAIVECAAHYKAPVLVHDGTPPFSLPSQAAMLAKRHPEATILLGHCGLYEHWREAIDALRLTPNLWGCICGPYAAGVRELLQRCDLDRLIWGSDFGYTVHDCVGYRMRAFCGAVPDERQQAAIFTNNPQRLFFARS
jgi:uncharacterized protein